MMMKAHDIISFLSLKYTLLVVMIVLVQCVRMTHLHHDFLHCNGEGEQFNIEYMER